MTAYVDERKEQANQNTAAGNAAIEEYNALMKKLNEEQAAANELSK